MAPEMPITVEVAAYILMIALSLVALNVLCWLTFRQWPLLLASENERLSLDYFSRFDGDLKPHIPEWFDIEAEDWPAFARECRTMIRLGGHVYDSFVEFKHAPIAGRFHNQDEGWMLVVRGSA